MPRITIRWAAVLLMLMLGPYWQSFGATPAGTSEALSLLNTERFDELERTFSDVQRRYKIGAITDEDLHAAFRVFYSTDPRLERKFDLWVERHPRSYVAHLARGIYFKKIGLEQRGPQSFRQTTSEQLRGMRENFSKASTDFTASYALDEKPLLTYMHAMNISLFSADRTEIGRLLIRANALDPLNVIARAAYMECLRARWGGSLDEMSRFVEQSRKEGLPNSKLRKLEAIVAEERAVQNAAVGNYEAAARDYRNAADLGREQCLPCWAGALAKAGKYAESIEVYTRALGSQPNDTVILANRAAIYMKLGKMKEALADLDSAARSGNAYSQNELGRMYMMGVPGVLTPDSRIGIEWFRKAAAQGNSSAIQNLKIAQEREAQPSH